MTVTRYINGKKVDESDLKNYVMDNEVILRIIQEVNERLKNNSHQSMYSSKSS